MILAGCLCLLLAALLDGDREALWKELERLRSGEVTGAEGELMQRRLAAAAGELEASPEAELLRLALAHLTGADVGQAAQRLAALEPSPFGARELWFLADALDPGPQRSRLLLTALDSTPTLGRWQLLLCWNAGVDEARALRLREGALPIQQRLYRRYPAEWSALDLALTLRQLGQQEAAEEVFRQALDAARASAQPTRELWSQRGIARAGFGDERRARDYLGQALALGSDDAGLVLGRMDLQAGRLEAARAGFRASILQLPPPDWSWRGWGTTLLPRAFEPPVPAGAVSPSTPSTNR